MEIEHAAKRPAPISAKVFTTFIDPAAAEDAARSHLDALWFRVAERSRANANSSSDLQEDFNSDPLRSATSYLAFHLHTPVKLTEVASKVAFTSAGNLSTALCKNCDQIIFSCKMGRLDEETNDKDVCLMWANAFEKRPKRSRNLESGDLRRECRGRGWRKFFQCDSTRLRPDCSFLAARRVALHIECRSVGFYRTHMSCDSC